MESEISINNVVISEDSSKISGGNNQAEFTVSLSKPATEIIAVNYTTVADTAQFDEEILVFIPEAIPRTNFSPADYKTTQGTLEFLPGETEKTILVEIIDDIYLEKTETFFVDLYKPVNGILEKDRGIGKIINELDELGFVIQPDELNPDPQSDFYTYSSLISKPIDAKTASKAAQCSNSLDKYDAIRYSSGLTSATDLLTSTKIDYVSHASIIEENYRDLIDIVIALQNAYTFGSIVAASSTLIDNDSEIELSLTAIAKLECSPIAQSLDLYAQII